MKKLNFFKTVQLIILLAFLAVCVWLIFFQRELYNEIARDPNLKMVCGMLWACFGLSLLFVFIDFTTMADYKRDFRELDFAVHSDPVSGLANRNSCDGIIDRYADKPVPKGVGCVMLELSNIRYINGKYGHGRGNGVIRDFSNILKMSSVSLCFVGRNGGNKFLAIFEESDRQQIDRFLGRIDQKIDAHNKANPELPIAYGCGIAFEEPEELTITQLVALADRRIRR